MCHFSESLDSCKQPLKRSKRLNKRGLLSLSALTAVAPEIYTHIYRNQKWWDRTVIVKFSDQQWLENVSMQRCTCNPRWETASLTSQKRLEVAMLEQDLYDSGCVSQMEWFILTQPWINVNIWMPLCQAVQDSFTAWMFLLLLTAASWLPHAAGGCRYVSIWSQHACYPAVLYIWTWAIFLIMSPHSKVGWGLVVGVNVVLWKMAGGGVVDQYIRSLLNQHTLI